jgi:hypothetical protein
LICSDAERAAVYERIRELIGLSKPKRGGSSGDNGGGEIGAGIKSECINFMVKYFWLNI